MSLRSWASATVDFLLVTVGLYVAVFPALSVGYALVAGAGIATRTPGAVAAVVAVGGSYPFVAGDWSSDRLWRFVAALLAAMAAATLLGLALLSGLDRAPPSRTLARAAVLAVAYPAATLVAFRADVFDRRSRRSS